MFASLKLYLYGAVLVALLGGGVYLHHKIYTQGIAAQKASDQRLIDKANSDKADAQSALGRLIATTNANTAADQAAAAKQKADADAAVRAAQANAADADKTLKTWMNKFATAIRSKDCGVALMQLCDQLRDY